ncbi:hypothetical protein HYQ44_020237 [Verticillium longisporum]|nr:hypothetical protein HYQ44_020237 [Verticillium longisporum]
MSATSPFSQAIKFQPSWDAQQSRLYTLRGIVPTQENHYVSLLEVNPSQDIFENEKAPEYDGSMALSFSSAGSQSEMEVQVKDEIFVAHSHSQPTYPDPDYEERDQSELEAEEMIMKHEDEDKEWTPHPSRKRTRSDANKAQYVATRPARKRSKPLNEHGRVWVFDTRTHAWTFLDPVPPAPGVTLTPIPAPRHGHAATATDRPRDFASRAPKRNQTWMAWAQGDSAEVGTPQAPIVGNVALHATDDDYDGFGTFFVHGGIVAPSSIASPEVASSEEKRACDLWAFDVRSRIWIELPAAPGPARAGAAMCVSKSRLFRFGGHDGSGPIGGQLDFVHLEVEMFDDGNSRGEVCVRARGGWQSIVAGASVLVST